MSELTDVQIAYFVLGFLILAMVSEVGTHVAADSGFGMHVLSIVSLVGAGYGLIKVIYRRTRGELA